MSLKEQARKLVEQADAAIRSNNPQYATELLRQSILYNGKDPDAYILLGIALAQVEMPADAENALKRATHMAPSSVKARYNLAVHQYSQGQVRAALNSARRAVELDPAHKGSSALVARIEGELGLSPGEQPRTTAAGNPVPVQFDETPDTSSLRPASFIDSLGNFWVYIGWTLAAISFAGLLLMISVVRPELGANLTADALLKTVSAYPAMKFVQALFFGCNIGATLWIGLDAIHRKGNLLWVVPQIFCGCIGFTWLTLPAYLIMGRRTEET